MSASESVYRYDTPRGPRIVLPIGGVDHVLTVERATRIRDELNAALRPEVSPQESVTGTPARTAIVTVSLVTLKHGDVVSCGARVVDPYQEAMDLRADRAALREIASKLFLCLSWDARQQAKGMLTEAERALLSNALDGEPNW